MKLHFLGGADEVGASCTLVEIEDQRILVDAGIRMNVPQNKKLPNFSVLDDVGMPDEVLITHAHTDHTGALPVLVNSLPESVKVSCTPATKAIAKVLLEDSAKLMAQRKEQSGDLPLYSPGDVAVALGRMVGVPWLETVSICDGALTATWIPAGHILGAAMIYIEGKRESILMTGDVSVANQLTIPGLVVSQCRPDVMVMESTYGNRPHADRAQQEAAFVQDVAEVIEAGGKVLIPAFAVGRSQEVILILKCAMQRKQIPEFPVYVDGMVQKVNDVYSAFEEDLAPAVRRKAERGEDIFYSGTVQSVTCEAKRNSVSSGKPCCIVASSGMLIGGRSSFYAEKLAGDPKNLIAITGYQAKGTPGCKLEALANGGESDEQVWQLNGESVCVKCQVERYSLSAHADRDELIGLVEKVQPHKLFLVHGDKDARRKLSRSVQKTSPNVGVKLPKNGCKYTYTKRVGIARGREFCRYRISEVYDLVMNLGSKGPFRVRELAEMWFGTEKMTLINEKVFHLSLKWCWQEFFVPDRRSPDLFHPVLIA